MTQEQLKTHPFITGEKAEFTEEDSKDEEEDTIAIISQLEYAPSERMKTKLKNQEFSESPMFETNYEIVKKLINSKSQSCICHFEQLYAMLNLHTIFGFKLNLPFRPIRL